MAQIAFLGLGNMGRPMAARLLQAGHRLTVWNRSAAKADALQQQGAAVAAAPHAAVAGAEAIFAMLGDDDASRQVWLGDDGVLAGAPSTHALAIECSTLSHGWVSELAGALSGHGLRYIDCPVTGLPDAAAASALTLLVGAADADLAEAVPLLQPLAREIIHFGPVGAGTSYKLMVNLMGSVQIAATAEGLLMAECAGLDLDKVVHALSRGAAASPQVIRNSAKMLRGEHDTDITFPARWRLKDANYGVALAAQLGVEARLGRAAASAFQRLVDAGFGDSNESKVIDALRT